MSDEFVSYPTTRLSIFISPRFQQTKVLVLRISLTSRYDVANIFIRKSKISKYYRLHTLC